MMQQSPSIVLTQVEGRAADKAEDDLRYELLTWDGVLHYGILKIDKWDW